MKNLIGISGKIGAGKDTVGWIIQWLTEDKERNYWDNNIESFLTINRTNADGWNWQIKKFASKLKQCAAIILGCYENDFEDEEFKNSLLKDEYLNNDPSGTLYSYRHFLQKLGTEVGRQIHPDTWVNALFSDYKEAVPTFNVKDIIGKSVYELGVAEAIKIYPYTLSGESKWIITDVRFPNEFKAIKDRGGINIRVKRKQDTSTHTSETALDNHEFDYTIHNSGTIEGLVEKVKLILKSENII